MKPRLIAFSVLAASALGLSACNEPKQAEREAPPRPVLVASVHYEPRERAQSLAGTIKARIESELAFRVGGRIERRLVDSGAYVTRGEPLASLDESDLKLQFQEAEAEQASARSALFQAEAEEKRVTSLAKQGWAASAEFDRVKATAEQARGAADKAARAVSLALNALNYATLTADADGVVSAIEAEPGQVVAAGAPVVRLSRTDVKEAAVAVPESLVDRVRAAKARAEYWALPGVTTQARLRELSPNADPMTRTYAARFTLPDAPAAARLGMSVTVTLSDGAQPLARVPVGAVFDAGTGPNVWTVDRNTGAVTATPIVVAAFDADSAYVASGLPEGSEVVALGVHKLDAKQKVRVVENLAGL
jgi:RND family efflux transporter MFP subunit